MSNIELQIKNATNIINILDFLEEICNYSCIFCKNIFSNKELIAKNAGKKNVKCPKCSHILDEKDLQLNIELPKDKEIKLDILL